MLYLAAILLIGCMAYLLYVIVKPEKF